MPWIGFPNNVSMPSVVARTSEGVCVSAPAGPQVPALGSLLTLHRKTRMTDSQGTHR